MNKNIGFAIVRNIARVVSIIMVAFFFIPTFMVSCSGQDYHISAVEIVAGLQNSSGHEVLEPHPGYVVLFLIPVIVAIFWLVSPSGIANGVITLILDGINLLVWFVLKMQAEEYCHEQYYDFECTELYWINILMHILMFILCFYAIGTDTVSKSQNSTETQEMVLPTKAENEPSIRCCCGKINNIENKYCAECGRAFFREVNKNLSDTNETDDIEEKHSDKLDTLLEKEDVGSMFTTVDEEINSVLATEETNRSPATSEEEDSTNLIDQQEENILIDTSKEIRKKGNGLAIASLILGIVALILSCFGIGILFAIVSIVIGIISLVKAQNVAMPIVGISLSVLSIAVASIMLMFTIIMPQYI